MASGVADPRNVDLPGGAGRLPSSAIVRALYVRWAKGKIVAIPSPGRSCRRRNIRAVSSARTVPAFGSGNLDW